MSLTMSSTLNPNTRMNQIGIRCSRTRKCSQRYEIDHFWPWFFASVQPLKFFLNPIREPAVSFNPTSQLLLKLRCGSTDVIWKYFSLLGFATGIIRNVIISWTSWRFRAHCDVWFVLWRYPGWHGRFVHTGKFSCTSSSCRAYYRGLRIAT